MPAWPGVLPRVPLLGTVETAPDLVVRTQMDAGPAKLRRRFTAGVRTFDAEFLLSEAQVAALDDFYVTATAGGSVRFDHVHPRTDATVEMRFTAPPAYEQITPSRWRARLKLEVMP